MQRYQWLIRLIFPLLLIWIAWEAIKRHGGWQFITQRLGWGPFPNTAASAPIWIHCASIGEVRLVAPLLLAEPEQAWLITCNTPTGFRMAQGLKHAKLSISYLPLDYPLAIKRFIAATLPQAMWVVETELWPNLFQTVHQSGIRITLINGRLSAKSLRAPGWLRQAYQACFACADRLLVRHQADADDFVSLGAPANKITVLGNLKFSHLSSPPHFSRPTQRDYVLVASCHPKEDLAIAEHWLALGRDELLVMVPRHPNHAKQLVQQLSDRNVTSYLASEQPSQNHCADQIAIWVDDRFGHLLSWYQHAHLVVMGGSFVSKGGHNFLEAAAYSKCILTGPDNRDFAQEAQWFEREGGLIICRDYHQLQHALNRLMNDAEARQQAGQVAKQAIDTQTEVLTAYRQALGRQVI